MTRILAGLTVLAFSGAAALATDLDISVESGGDNAVTVPAGSIVNYTIVGELSDNANEGLALWGGDVTFSAGDLEQADLPGEDPMLNFTLGAGITNPITANNVNGYGGTIIDGVLVQVGGGQNTINNTPDNAPFPIGAVIVAVAANGSPQILATGSLMAPEEEGAYTLSVSNLFANVIKEGEDGAVFWATEEAGTGTLVPLTITVGGDVCVVTLIDADPPNDAIDARQPSEPDGSNPAGISSIDITFSGDASCVVAGDFTITQNPAGTPPEIANITTDGNTVTLELTGMINVGAWTTFTHATGATRIGYLPADVNNDSLSNATDVLTLIDHLNGAIDPLADYQCDADRSGQCNASDVLRVIDLLNGAGVYDVYNGATLPG